MKLTFHYDSTDLNVQVNSMVNKVKVSLYGTEFWNNAYLLVLCIYLDFSKSYKITSIGAK